MPTTLIDVWNCRLAELAEFKKRNGHCDVPHKYPPNQRLAGWVNYVRVMKKRGRLAKERVRCLDALGFRWVIKNRTVYRYDWDGMMGALADFKRRHGHCDVPRGFPDNPQLGLWLAELRRKKRTGRLDRQRIKQLERSGVTWEPWQQRWDEMCAALDDYKRQHGNCGVPAQWPENPRLGRWVCWVRNLRKADKLDPDCIQRLDALGFIWDQHAARWESMYCALVKFQKTHGHCMVSTLSKTRLGVWVKVQRAAKRQNKLSEERVRRLESLGFTWEMQPWEGRRLHEKTPRPRGKRGSPGSNHRPKANGKG